MDAINAQLFSDLLGVGALGLVFGVAFPFIFLMIGYVIDVVRNIFR